MKPAGQARRCAPALAAALLVMWPASGFGQSLDHDSSLPIEITADSLEVAQKEQVATFAGDVDAVQGDLVLSADKLRVYYEGKAKKIGLATGTGSTIRRIEAEGEVLLSSPQETASGDFGVYDVPAKLVTLEGSVVLTRGDNVVRGERLVMDLATGKSRMVAVETVAEDDKAVKKPDGRVRALFTPKQKASKSDDGGDDAPPAPAARPK